eukprot:TRINITY_DN28064_c0_g1_i2.p1 TRINITY_DN28064_c0_g1~~TRINITY_DN28064_c0_g1_i2.p1  ORF type:complete len:495 (+),score=69.39 TRINITY_DN28064_c0_g1_i2:66-1487(+)
MAGVQASGRSAPTQASAASLAEAAQHVGERFAQLYYGLLAVKPSELRQFYTEDSQMSRSWCSSAGLSPDKLPRGRPDVCRGLTEISEKIMESVGGQDGTSDEPVVVTNVESVQSSSLGNLSGVMAHITGLITFVAEGKIRRFSQSVVIEPCPKGRLCVRSDIVHYDDVNATRARPVPVASESAASAPGSSLPVEEAQAVSAVAEPAVGSPSRQAAELATGSRGASSPAAAPATSSSSATPERSGGGGSVSWAAIAAGSKAAASPASSATQRQRLLGTVSKASSPAVPVPAAPSEPPVAAAPSTAESETSEGAAKAPAAVKLWVSGIPTEVQTELNKALREHAPHLNGEVLEVDRKDDRKPFAFCSVSDERTAKELVLLGKAKKVQLRGERLVLDLSNYNTARVETLYAGGTGPAGRGHWRESGEESRENRSWGGNRGKGSGGKRDDGWAPREHRGGKGRGSREAARDNDWRAR